MGERNDDIAGRLRDCLFSLCAASFFLSRYFTEKECEGGSEGALKISQTQCNKGAGEEGKENERECAWIRGAAVSADKSAYGN